MNPLSDETEDMLVAYALGALEPEEMARVAELLAARPELRAALAELRASADLLPRALDAEPPADLRQRTLDRALGRASPAPRAAPRPAPWRRISAALGGLAGALAVVAGLLWAQLGAAEAELDRARSAQRQVVAVLARPDALVALGGEGRGAVVRQADGTIVMAASLPALRPGRTYQLWFISGQSAPTPSATFTVDEQGLALVTLRAAEAAGADTFAVTDEPAGGSPAPTTKPLLAGQVGARG